MKTFKSKESLENFLADQFVWRRKELHDLKALIREKKGSVEIIKPIIKGGIVLGYSHWEGYIKEVSEAYLAYISFRDFSKKEMAGNFLTLCILDIVKKEKEYMKCVEDITKFIDTPDDKYTIPHGNIIDTKSNLNSEVLRKIMNIIGLDFSFYETKQAYLDNEVLGLRNQIAHGEQREKLTVDTYIERADFVVECMGHYKELLQNAIDNRLYLKEGLGVLS